MEQRTRMPRIGRWIVRIAGVLLIGGLFLWVNQLRRRDQEAIVDEIRMAVVVSSPQERTIRRTFSIASWVEAERLVTLSPKVSGTLVSLSVPIGARVESGEVIGSVDREPYLLARNQARAAFDSAWAAYERANILSEAGSMSDQMLEQARVQYETAQSQLENAELNLANTEIVATVSGNILQRHRNAGELVSPTVPIVTIGALDELIVTTQVPERYARFFVDQQEVMSISATIPALADQEYSARIRHITPYIAPETRTFEVACSIVGDTRYILPGMFINLRFTTAVRNDVLSLPTDALVGEDTLWYVDPESSRARSITVGTLFYNDEFFQVPEELRGRRFIVEGHHFLRDDTIVRVVGDIDITL